MCQFREKRGSLELQCHFWVVVPGNTRGPMTKILNLCIIILRKIEGRTQSFEHFSANRALLIKKIITSKELGKKSSSDSYSIFFIVSKFVLKLKGQSLCLLALRCSLDLDRHSYKRRPKKIKGNVAPVLFQIWWWLYLDDTQCTIFVMSKLGGSEEISHPYFHFSRSQLSFSRSNTWYGATLVSTIFGFV